MGFFDDIFDGISDAFGSVVDLGEDVFASVVDVGKSAVGSVVGTFMPKPSPPVRKPPPTAIPPVQLPPTPDYSNYYPGMQNMYPQAGYGQSQTAQSIIPGVPDMVLYAAGGALVLYLVMK